MLRNWIDEIRTGNTIMNVALNNRDLQQKILVEQIRLLYKPTLPLIGVNLFVCFALTIALWDFFPHLLLLIWIAVMVITLLYRLLIYIIFRSNFNKDNVKQFATYYVVGTAITGILWGLCSIFLFPEQSLKHQFVIIAILIGLGAGAVTTYNNYLPAFIAFYLPTLMPLNIKLYLLNDFATTIFAISLTIYIVYMFYYCIVLHRSHKESLRLRFENVDLIDQLREQKDEAERANLAKSKFLAAASHDLRQPLHAISLFTSVLKESKQTPDNRKVVSQIDSSVHALEALFNALLDISRLDAGTMKVEKQHFLLQPMLDRLKNDFESQSIEKGIHLLIADCNDVLYSDPNLLEQILRNLISNAIRYTEKGEVRMDCVPHDGKLLISVNDTGIGIPSDERDRIFDEFHQLNNPERDRSKGLGLGLAIVRRTANLLAHHIDVHSKPGKGSVFSIMVEIGNRNEVVEDIKPDSIDTLLSGRPVLFVIIDDEVSVRAGMHERLTLWGYNVITAADQDEAIDILRQAGQKPDGIVTDYRLRNKRTGIDAIKAIHAEYGNDIPALIITGDTAIEQLREVNDSGYLILHKPAAPAKLRTFLRNIQRRVANTDNKT
jgi:two-component system, sensor histidine kinase